MSYRKQIKQQRRLAEQARERAHIRRRAVRSGLAIGAAVIALTVAIAIGFTFAPTGGTSSSDPEELVLLTMSDDYFEPARLTIKAGQSYQIKLLNQGLHPHNVWLVGPNGDETRSDDYAGGESGSMKVRIDQPGEYGFVCTFHAQMGGRLVVEP